MDYLERFSIPIKGMNLGIHEYLFDIDNEFFSNFENSLISEGEYEVKVNCDKKERMYILNFEISGTYSSKCDRCLTKIEIPSLIDYKIFLKYGIAGKDFIAKDSDDVIYIDEGDFKYNLSGIIHQLIILSLPFTNTYDCENDPNPKCDFEMLEYLEGEKEKITNDEEIVINPIWEKLKKDFNNN